MTATTSRLGSAAALALAARLVAAAAASAHAAGDHPATAPTGLAGMGLLPLLPVAAAVGVTFWLTHRAARPPTPPRSGHPSLSPRPDANGDRRTTTDPGSPRREPTAAPLRPAQNPTAPAPFSPSSPRASAGVATSSDSSPRIRTTLATKSALLFASSPRPR